MTKQEEELNKLLLHFSTEAMRMFGPQLCAKSRTDAEIKELCRKSWAIGYAMLAAKPLLTIGESEQPTAEKTNDNDRAGAEFIEVRPVVGLPDESPVSRVAGL